MVFCVNLGLSNLVNSAADDRLGKNYALFIGDTVLVNEVITTMTRLLCTFQSFILLSVEWSSNRAYISIQKEDFKHSNISGGMLIVQGGAVFTVNISWVWWWGVVCAYAG